MRAPATSILMLVCVLAAAQVPDQHVQLLFDSTYSMGLPSGDTSRSRRVIEHLPDVLRQLGAATVSLSVLGQGDEPMYRGEFDTIESTVSALLSEPTYGRGSITRALSFLRLRTVDPPDAILLVTDAEEPRPVSGGLPAEVPLHLYVVDTGTPSAERTIRSLRPHLATLFHLSPDGALHTSSPVTDHAASRSPPLFQTNGTAERSQRAGLGRILVFVIAGLAVMVLLIVLLYLALEHVRFRKLRQRIRTHNAIAPELSVSLRGAGVPVETQTRTYPFTIGFSASDGLELPPSVSNEQFAAGDRVTIERTADGFRYHSTVEVRVTGMRRTEGPVTPGLQVKIGRARLCVDAIEQRKVKREPRPYHFEKLPLAGISFAATVVFGLIGLLVGPGPARVLPQPQRLAASTSPPHVVSVQRSYGRPLPDRPQVFSSVDEIPWFDADFLAVHAHPDDEALDFGSLLATLTASGRRGVQVLLTDGESGQDLHPERTPRRGYPVRELRGAELAQVRIRETQLSLSWLGVEHYVRLGYRNHPYNSIHDEMSPSELLEVWGGGERVAEQLTELIVGYTPEILISPDQPSTIVEHFEHDATGIVSALAYERAAAVGHPPRVHIVSIDPLQVDAATDLSVLPAWDVPGHGHSVSARDRQIAALDAHLTQLDAHVNGVETRQGLLYEFYRVVAGHDSLRDLIPQLRSPIDSR